MGQQFLIYRISDKFFAAALEDIVRVIPSEKVFKIPLTRDCFDGLIRFDDRPIPLFNLGKFFGLDDESAVKEKLVAVYRHKESTIGFVIEGVEKVTDFDTEVFSDCDEKMSAVAKKLDWEGKEVYLIDYERMLFADP